MARPSTTMPFLLFLITFLASNLTTPVLAAATANPSHGGTPNSPGAAALQAQPRPNQGPRIMITPNEPFFYINTQEPSSKVLTCQTAGDKPSLFTQLRWTGPNRVDNWDELSKRHSVTEEEPDSNIWNLEFRSPTMDDAGIYYCFGSFQSADQLNASIQVKIHNPVRLENCPERQFILLDSSTAKVTCRITADTPKVSIMKNNVTIDQYDNRYKWDNEDGLIINGLVNHSDAGRYQIKVKSILTGERVHRNIDVEINSKPEIVPFNGSETITEFYGVEGEPAQLKCQVSGNPRPIVDWLDPKLRNVSSVGGYTVEREHGTLLIQKVNKVEDSGWFQCVAWNSVGSTSRRVSMAVYTRPQIVAFENKTADENSEVTFECRSTGEPQPVFAIRRHGIDQQPYRIGDGFVRDINTQAEGGGSNVFVHRLTILATRQLFGLHYCNVTNQAGTAERFGQLLVNYAPDLSLTPAEQFFKLGRRITVTCHIKAYPQPKVSWWSDNTQIINVESKVTVSPDGHTHVVTMSPPNPQQTAFSKFVCRAENQMGQAEQVITPRFKTAPGVVTATLVERAPTSVKLQLAVPNDGGDRIKAFKYRLDGRTLDFSNPLFEYRADIQNESTIDALLSSSSTYTIRNLLPYYTYRITIRAVNDVGEGDSTDIRVETTKPTRPEPPVIIRSNAVLSPYTSNGVPSEYANGYMLKWGPPETDNGDVITKYVITWSKLATNSLDITVDSGERRVVEQMNERPMHARLGPLETNSRYRIQLQARNNFGESDSSTVIIYTPADRPPMPEFDGRALAWLTEPSTPFLIILLCVAVVALVLIDLLFCFCCHIGVTYMTRQWCCPSKTNSVISDKTYS